AGGVFDDGFWGSERALRARAVHGPVPIPAARSSDAASQAWTRQVVLRKSAFLYRCLSRPRPPQRRSLRRLRVPAPLEVKPADLFDIILGFSMRRPPLVLPPRPGAGVVAGQCQPDLLPRRRLHGPAEAAKVPAQQPGRTLDILLRAPRIGDAEATGRARH